MIITIIILIPLLEAYVREDLNKQACRVSAVLDPVKLAITNYPEGETEEMEAINNPENEADGTHTITFSKNLWIERADFMEDAPKKFFRMTPGKEVRLKNAYIVKCTGCTKDENGVITEIQAEYDPIVLQTLSHQCSSDPVAQCRSSQCLVRKRGECA